MLECVVNVSEGRNADVVAAIAAVAGDDLLDVHRDPHHNRSVLTLVGEEAPRRVAREAVARIDIGVHVGAHPRIGAVDVVPFVPLEGSTMVDARRARDAFARWAADELALPCFLYGEMLTLPELRRRAFVDLPPDTGPPAPHPTAGAAAVGARDVLVAYNVWLAEPDIERARAIARDIRGPHLRALGLAIGDAVQVSMNLLAPTELTPAAAFDLVAARAEVARAELVGLLPARVLAAIDFDRWEQLDVGPDRSLEGRLAAAGRRTG